MPEFATLEEAQAEILRLNEVLTLAETDKENYSTIISEMSAELEKVRTINQQYFLKLSAQYAPPKPEDNDEDVLSCEDFAKNLTI